MNKKSVFDTSCLKQNLRGNIILHGFNWTKVKKVFAMVTKFVILAGVAWRHNVVFCDLKKYLLKLQENRISIKMSK